MSKATATRLAILTKAFELIYTKNYQTTSIDDILATTGVTKGAFYYHFKNKDEMGVAIVEELLKPVMREQFILPVSQSQDPVATIYDLTYNLLLENPMLKQEYGCPAGNMIAEMTPWNDAFFIALSGLMDEWLGAIVQCIENGKQNGSLKNDVNAEQVAVFIISGYWGVRDLGKVRKTTEVYGTYLNELRSYLGNLKS